MLLEARGPPGNHLSRIPGATTQVTDVSWAYGYRGSVTENYDDQSLLARVLDADRNGALIGVRAERSTLRACGSGCRPLPTTQRRGT